MRRKWAAAVIVAGLFAVGACGDDGNGGDGGDGGDEATGKTNEEVCTDVEAAATEMQTELQTVIEAATTAAQSGDQAAALTALQDLQTAIGDFTETMRTNADEAEDPETADTLNTAADELDTALENLDLEAIEAGGVPDTAPLDQAMADVHELCGAA